MKLTKFKLTFKKSKNSYHQNSSTVLQFISVQFAECQCMKLTKFKLTFHCGAAFSCLVFSRLAFLMVPKFHFSHFQSPHQFNLKRATQFITRSTANKSHTIGPKILEISRWKK